MTRTRPSGAPPLALALATAVAAALLPTLPAAAAGADRPGWVDGLPSGVAEAALEAEPSLPVPDGWAFPDAFPRTSGTGRLVGGAFEWTDWVYDAYGATDPDAEPLNETTLDATSLAPASGSYVYPEGPANDNGADMFRAAVGLTPTSTVWRVDFNTLVDPAVPIAAWTFDTDDDPATGGADWPAQANVSSPGIELALVVGAGGARLVDVEDAATIAEYPTRVDTAARSFVVEVPRADLPVAGTWRVRLAAGLAADDGTGFAVPTLSGGSSASEDAPRIYNITFRTAAQEPPRYAASDTAPASDAADQVQQTPVVGPKGTGAVHSLLTANHWSEAAQAEALAGGDVSAFSAQVDWDRLRDRDTTPPAMLRGWSERWYASGLDLGQGIDFERDGTVFVGRVQPYAVYVPESYEAGQPTPLTLYLHSASSNYKQYAATNPRASADLCEERGSICVTPEAFGDGGLYAGIAEHDVWQVWRQAALAFTLDPERTVVTGYSMGGLGSFVIPANYPEAFAASMPLDGGFDNACSAAPPGASNFLITESPDRSGNTHWIPYVISDSYTDELSPYPNNAELARRLVAAGNRFSMFSTTMPEHILTSVADGFATQIEALGGTPRRTTTPATVDYAWCGNVVDPDLGLRPTSVYWLSGLTQRTTDDPFALSHVVAVSNALPQPEITTAQDTTVVAPDDAPPMHVLTNTWSVGDAPPTYRTMQLTLANVAALAVDTQAARLPTGEAEVETDGPATLTLAGLVPGTLVRAGDTTMTAGSGSVTVELPAGTSTVTWSGGDAGGRTALGAPGIGGGAPLPATGGGRAAIALAVIGLALLARRRRL